MEFEEIQDRWLDICEKLTGQRKKLSLVQISDLITKMSEINASHASIVAFQVYALGEDAKREFGAKWWYRI